MQDYPCKGLYRVRGSLTFLRSERVWSCARINPNARELPLSRQTGTQRASWAVLRLPVSPARAACVSLCVHMQFQFSAQTVSLYEYVLGNNVPIGSGDINNVCGEAHKCKLEFSSVVFVLNHLDETILKALSFPWHLE